MLWKSQLNAHGKSLLGWTCLFALLFSGCKNTVDEAPPIPRAAEIKVVTWNLKWFPGKRQDPSSEQAQAHVDEVKLALAKIAPDIFLAQEIRDPGVFEEVIENVGHTAHVISNFSRRGNFQPQETAITSRFLADSGFAEAFAPGAHGVNPPRGFAFAAISIEGERVVLLYSVHLKSNAGGDKPEGRLKNISQREEAARQIVSHVAQMKKQYGLRLAGIVVGGDFNNLETPEYAGEQTFNILKAAGLRWMFAGVPLRNRVTWPSDGKYSDASFDHFFVFGVKQATSQVLPIDGPSDHRPVVLTLRLE